MELKQFSWKELEALAIERVQNDSKLEELTKDGIYLWGIPRGGIPVSLIFRRAIEKVFGAACICEVVSDIYLANVIVDDLIDSGATMQKYEAQFPKKHKMVLVPDKTVYGGQWLVFPWETNEQAGPEENVRRMLEFAGDDPSREGLVETPKRVVKAFSKVFGGYNQDPAEVMKTFTEGACNSMVLLKNIEFYSTCEHHMLPFYGKCHIAYIPNGKVIGVSKLARLMEIYSRRLQIQERIGQQITAALEQYLNPLGAACIIEAQHFCMTSRGVEKQNAKMVTSSLTGAFERSEVRKELLDLIKG